MFHTNTQNDKILHKKTLKKHILKNVKSLNKFLKKKNEGIIVFVNQIEDIYKRSDNIIEDIKRLYSYKNKNITDESLKISIIDFELLKDLFPLEFEVDKPFLIYFKNGEIEDILDILEFENMFSLIELNSYLIEDFKELNYIFESDSVSLLIITDDLEKLSNLLPEPKKNIISMYDHFFKVDVSNLDINVLYTDKDTLKSVIRSEEIIPLPIVFKVDRTGTVSFPIHIKKINTNTKTDLSNYNIDSLTTHYKELLK